MRNSFFSTLASVLTAVSLMSFMLLSCSKPEPDTPPAVDEETGIESVSLSPSDTTVSAGEKFLLKVSLTPSGVDADTVSGVWSSDDPDVASVDNDGMVTAVAEGSTVIVYSIGDTLSAECTVTVLPEDEPMPDAIALSEELVRLSVGETADINVIAAGSDNWTHPDLLWSSSDEEAVTVSSDGEVTARAFGSVCVMASVGDLYAYCMVIVEDASQPVEYDPAWLSVPYPYLEWPTTADRIKAAENASTEDELLLRKLTSESGGILTYEIRDYFDHGPASPMFNNTFYDLNAREGERFAWGYCLGISSQDMVDGVMVELMAEQGYVWKKKIDMEDGSYAAWYANGPADRSALIYVQPYNDDPDRMYGVIEYRVLEDDPLNDGSGEESADKPELPERFMDFGALMEDVRKFESGNGGVLNEAWCYSSTNLAYDIPVDQFGTYFANYVFDGPTEKLYWIQLFGKEPYQFFNEDNSTLRADLVDSMNDAGWSDRGDNIWLDPSRGITVKFIFYDYDVITGDYSYPTFCLDYEVR